MRIRDVVKVLTEVGGFREHLPNLEGWNDEEILEMLPDQDSRYDQEGGLGDMLADIPYKVKVGYCIYCDEPVSDETEIPAADDDVRWGEIAAQHYVDCEWIHTRAHRRDP